MVIAKAHRLRFHWRYSLASSRSAKQWMKLTSAVTCGSMELFLIVNFDAPAGQSDCTYNSIFQVGKSVAAPIPRYMVHLPCILLRGPATMATFANVKTAPYLGLNIKYGIYPLYDGVA